MEESHKGKKKDKILSGHVSRIGTVTKGHCNTCDTENIYKVPSFSYSSENVEEDLNADVA